MRLDELMVFAIPAVVPTIVSIFPRNMTFSESYCIIYIKNIIINI